MELEELLQNYLARRVEVGQITDWVALNIWDAEGDLRDFIHEIAIELAHLDDGYADEDYFRSQIADILNSRRESIRLTA